MNVTSGKVAMRSMVRKWRERLGTYGLSLSVCAMLAPGYAESAPAPLPDGVAASGKTVQGLYVEGLATMGADLPGPQILAPDPKHMFDVRSQQCMLQYQRPARIVQGRLEDLYQPARSQAYFSGDRSVGFSQSWMMLRNPDDSTGCDFRVFLAASRSYWVFENGHTTVTEVEWNGKVKTRVTPGRMDPPSFQHLNNVFAPHGVGPLATPGGLSSVAGIPCRKWQSNNPPMLSDLCIPEAEHYPEPLSKMSLKSKVTGPDGKVLTATEVEKLLIDAEIDEAVFEIPKSVQRTR